MAYGFFFLWWWLRLNPLGINWLQSIDRNHLFNHLFLVHFYNKHLMPSVCRLLNWESDENKHGALSLWRSLCSSFEKDTQLHSLIIAIKREQLLLKLLSRERRCRSSIGEMPSCWGA